MDIHLPNFSCTVQLFRGNLQLVEFKEKNNNFTTKSDSFGDILFFTSYEILTHLGFDCTLWP